MPSASPPKGPGNAEISQLNLSKPKLTGDIVPPGNITQRQRAITIPSCKSPRHRREDAGMKMWSLPLSQATHSLTSRGLLASKEGAIQALYPSESLIDIRNSFSNNNLIHLVICC